MQAQADAREKKTQSLFVNYLVHLIKAGAAHKARIFFLLRAVVHHNAHQSHVININSER